MGKFSKAEIQIFWAGLVGAPVIWALLFFTALFSLKLKWVVLVIIGLALSGSNLIGYLRCRMGSSVSGAANKYLQQRVLANMMNMFKTNNNPHPRHRLRSCVKFGAALCDNNV